MAVPAGYVGNSDGTYTRQSDGAGPFATDGTNMFYTGKIFPTIYASGNVANVGGAVAIPAVAGKTAFITGFDVTGAGATAASVVLITVVGTLGGTMTYNLAIPAGVNTSINPLLIQYETPIPASAANVAISVNTTAFGAGNTNTALVVRGFYI